MTKLGLHVNKVTNLLVPFVRDTKPRLIKFLDHDVGTIKACHDVSPNSILIGRLFVTDQSSDQPQKNAQTLVDKILPIADRLRDYYLAWESYTGLRPVSQHWLARSWPSDLKWAKSFSSSSSAKSGWAEARFFVSLGSAPRSCSSRVLFSRV